jgi:hypothetical protein
LVNLLGVWDINLDRVRRELRVEKESGVQMIANEVRVNVPFGEDFVYKERSGLHLVRALGD